MTVNCNIVLDIDVTALMSWLHSLFPPSIKDTDFANRVASDWHSYLRRYTKLTFGIEMLSFDEGQEAQLFKKCFYKSSNKC